ncbi:MAG: DUF1835 domain-containing protein [Roseomonas sp.]|nr:DUF1835 domain-containing protein [Roseomonas sp.]
MPAAAPPSLVNPLHLVTGDSAAGCLRAACASFGIPGVVVSFADDLAQGPLNDDAARIGYMREVIKGYGDEDIDGYTPFGEWRLVVEHLKRARTDAVIIWTGNNVNDATFIAMACDRLMQRHEPVWRISVSGRDTGSHVAMYSPEQLAAFYANRVLLSSAERQQLTQDFVRIRETSGLLRRLEADRVIAVPVEYYDPLLLAACGPDWQMAARVVGAAMGSCDRRNLMGDVFFSARLNALIDAGRIEAKGPRTALRDYSVRRLKG